MLNMCINNIVIYYLCKVTICNLAGHRSATSNWAALKYSAYMCAFKYIYVCSNTEREGDCVAVDLSEESTMISLSSLHEHIYINYVSF